MSADQELIAHLFAVPCRFCGIEVSDEHHARDVAMFPPDDDDESVGETPE